jgi:hypothetical protein
MVAKVRPNNRLHPMSLSVTRLAGASLVPSGLTGEP